MSAVCVACNEDISPPNGFWCAFTMFSPESIYVCGNCLKLIPDEHKISFQEPPLFQILFARRIAEVGISGNYQGLDSRSGKPEYWVDADIISSYLPGGDYLLMELHPYYCIAELLRQIIQSFDQKTPESKALATKMLCKYGAPLEALLFQRKKKDLVRPITFRGDPSNLTEKEKELVKELLEQIL